ncbi:MAG: hypothetical protein G8D61_00365 [gamma proteobacterium symbiont of Ctena orbiculata]
MIFSALGMLATSGLPVLFPHFPTTGCLYIVIGIDRGDFSSVGLQAGIIPLALMQSLAEEQSEFATVPYADTHPLKPYRQPDARASFSPSLADPVGGKRQPSLCNGAISMAAAAVVCHQSFKNMS